MNSNQEYWVLYATGEHTALLTWLEFPDCNIQVKSGLFASCVPVGSTWNLYSGPSSNGQDGVFIGGCSLNECNYITHGNYDALSNVYLCKKMMERIGLNPERLRIEFMSGADGNLLAEVTDDFTQQDKGVGANRQR